MMAAWKPPPITPGRKAEIAECFVDVALLPSQIATAGLLINDAVIACADNHRAACTADISGIINAFASLSQFLALAISQCPVNTNSKAFCAADISELVSGVAQIVQASAGIAQACPTTFGFVNSTGPTFNGPGRAQVTVSKATCVINAADAGFFLMRAGLYINAAVGSCPNAQPTAGTQSCAADIATVIISFASVGQAVSAAAAKCGYTVAFGSSCSADISSLTAALAKIAGAGAGMAAECKKTSTTVHGNSATYQALYIPRALSSVRGKAPAADLRSRGAAPRALSPAADTAVAGTGNASAGVQAHGPALVTHAVPTLLV